MKVFQKTLSPLVVALLIPSVVRAAEPRFVTAIFPPLAMEAADGSLTGLAPETLREIARRLGATGSVEILPSARVTQLTRSTPNMILTQARTPERERDLRWIGCGSVDATVLVSRRDRPYLKIAETPRDATLAVLHGSTNEVWAREAGFTNIVTIRADESGPAMVRGGHVDGWLTYRSAAMWRMDAEERDADRLVISDPARSVSLWLAASLSTPPERVERWRGVFTAMRRDGTVARLLERYGGNTLPCEDSPE